MIYLILFITIAVLAFSHTLGDSLKRDLVTPFWVIIALLVLFGTIRWESGTDWLSYHGYLYRFYNLRDIISYKAEFEPGFALLYFALRPFGNYTLILFFVSLLAIVPKAIAIRKSNYFYLSLLLYFTYTIGDIFAVRQSIAVAICLYSVKYIEGKDRIRFLGAIFWAFMFHTSAIVFVFAYRFFYWKSSRIKVLSYFIIAAIFGFVLSLFLGELLRYLFSIFIHKGNLNITDRLLIYIENDAINPNIDTKLAYIKGLSKRSLFVFIFSFFLRRGIITNQDRGIFNIWFAGVLLYIILVPSYFIFGRFTIYYGIFEILLLPKLIKGFKKYDRIIIVMIIIIFSCIKLVESLSAYWDLYVPYHSIFSGNIQSELY